MQPYRWALFITLTMLFITTILFCSTPSAQNDTTLLINELMYQPHESDHYHEWIELYNPTNTPINVSGWTIWDGQEEDTIIGNHDHGNGTTIIPPQHYAILTDQGTHLYDHYNIPNTTIKLYVNDATLGGYGLKNSGEFILLNNTHHHTVDTIEWTHNTPHIPGQPAFLVNTGETLIRTTTQQTESLLTYTYSRHPTPGTTNHHHTHLPYCPQYLAKPPNPTQPSIPCSYQYHLSHFPHNTTYHLKAYLTTNPNITHTASQTYNNHIWRYSNNYTHTLTTNTTGTTHTWLHLRINPTYQHFHHLRNHSHTYLIIKIKNHTHTYYTTTQLTLLDMTTYTTNATPGGHMLGCLPLNHTIIQNTPLLVTNTHGTLLSLYFLENNTIPHDHTPTLPGYYNLAVPTGHHYTLSQLTNNKTIPITTHLHIQQGEYTHTIKSIQNPQNTTPYHSTTNTFIIRNTGQFSDTYHITYTHPSPNWTATYYPKTITLAPKEIAFIYLTTTPQPPNPGSTTTVFIHTQSEINPIITHTASCSINLHAPDLTPTNISLWHNNTKQNTFIQGQHIKIKAHIKNQGTINATNTTIHFYHIDTTKKTLIDTCHYDTISNYYKYPSILWDTSHIPPGKHTIEVRTDPSNTIPETDETNNQYRLTFIIIPLMYDQHATNIKITQFYYHTRPNLNNEFITITNPTNKSLNISNWYITTTPNKPSNIQTKIQFPTTTIFPPYASWYLTQNASAFYHQQGFYPHYEYKTDSNKQIPNLYTTKTVTLSNTKGCIALKSPINDTIDYVCYGSDQQIDSNCWVDQPLPHTGQGRVHKRKTINSLPIDTNSTSDWQHDYFFGIGQSRFTFKKIHFHGSCTAFVSPDCSFSTIAEQITSATQSLHLNMYEFTNPELYHLLVDALHRNIRVYIFMEGSPIGGIDEREQYILTNLHALGAQIQFITSNSQNKIFARYRFDHAKYLIIDNKSVIIESCNWVKTGVPKDPSFGNREWGIVIENKDVVHCFLQVFNDDFNPSRSDSCNISSYAFDIDDDFVLDDTIPYGRYIPQFNSTTFTSNVSVLPVFSPDNSLSALCDLIESAQKSIFIQQLYIYTNWGDQQSPLVARLLEKADEGIDIRIILNYNPAYEPTNIILNQTRDLFESYGIRVKYLYTNWSVFTNSHTKGMIVDNKSVLISSINWNENSFMNNREAGVIVENPKVAAFFSDVFLYDWYLKQSTYSMVESFSLEEYTNQILIVGVYAFTFALIIHDWRKRQWT